MIVDPKTITLGGVDRSLIVEALHLKLQSQERIAYAAKGRISQNIGSYERNTEKVERAERNAANVQELIDRLEAL